MRVVHLLTSLNPGGVATYMTHLLPELARRGVQSELVLTRNRGLVADALEGAGYPSPSCLQHGRQEVPWSYRLGKLIRRSAILTFQTRLAQLLRRLKPDIVHSHAHGDHWDIQLRAAHQAEAPLLITLHSPSSTYPYTRKARLFYTQQLRPGDCIVAPGPGIYAAYETFLLTIPTHVYKPGSGIPYGLPDPGLRDAATSQDIRQQLRIPSDAIVIGNVGRLIPEKRIVNLLDALHNLVQERPAIYGILVGDGSARAALEEQTRRLRLESHVRLVGWQTNPTHWLNAVDIYVLPSLSEGLPVAILEAMAKGLPIVATEVNGTCDLITDLRTGLLVPPEDVPALEQAIRRLIASPDLRQRLGEAARREFLAHYNIDRSAAAYLSLYEQMLSEWRENGSRRKGTGYAA